MAKSERPIATAATVRSVAFEWLFPVAAIHLPAGLFFCTLASTWKRPEGSSFIESLFSSTEGRLGVLLTVVAALGIWRGVWTLSPIEAPSAQKESERRYNRYLVGVGYSLFVCGVFCCALVAGLIYSKGIPVSAAAFEASILGKTQGLGKLIVLSSVIAVLGALFFVANSLRHKREARVELFSRRKFWGGLWYRLGEAILFSLVAFWLIWYNTPTTTNAAAPRQSLLGYGMLPVLSLLMGMFVTSGEKLIFGIARGLFRAAGAFFGSSDDRELESVVEKTSGAKKKSGAG